MTYRVVQWSTGNVGSYALNGILLHPELELVGVYAHGSDKQGKDAGQLCAYGASTGITATGNVDKLLALKPDCVCYTANNTVNENYLEETCRLLEAGINVSTTSNVRLCYPQAPFNKELVERLERSCQQGGSTLFTSGMDPGASGDYFPLALSSLSERVDSIRVVEMMNYASYPDPDYTGYVFGYGRPPEFEAPLFVNNRLTNNWGPMIYMLADALRVEIDEIREVYETSLAEETIDCPMGLIRPGTVDGVYFQVQGIVKGKAMIVAEHVNRLRPTTDTDDWPTMADGSDTGYRLEISGEPSFVMEVHMQAEDGNHTTAGTKATAMRVVNAIPAVCRAQPGVKSVLDLPIITAHGYSGAR